jgi:hypothetical protein
MSSQWQRTTRRVGAAAALLIGTIVFGACGGAPAESRPMNWHAQSGKEGPVADGAVGKLTRSDDGISFEIATEALEPNHAYTIWLAMINEPSACTTQPCPTPEFLQNPATDAQVVFGAGAVADENGKATFKGERKMGPIPEGWLAGGELKKPLTAQVLLVVNSHGPVIEGYMPDMIETYRAGCADAGLPEVFPPTAKADGRPGPNTCQLTQSVVFPGG